MAGITKDQHRLELAKKLGADHIVNTQEEDLSTVVFSATGGYGVDKIYDASGSIQAVNTSLPLLKKRGEFIQVGLFKEKFNALDSESTIQREINYVGSRSQNPFDWLIAIHLLAKGAIHIKEMITKIYPLDEWRHAFEQVIEGNEIKVLIESNGRELTEKERK